MTDSAGRREFLRRAAALGVTGAAAPFALNLAAMGEAAAQSASDYKALVCVFLFGANDNGNTVVPYDASGYNNYARLRSNLAIPRDKLNNNMGSTVLEPLNPPGGGAQWALAPELAPLLPVFNAGRMGVLMNVGPLIQPTTKTQYLAKSVPLPPKLFSHNDQQSMWQSCNPEGATSGWGGRIGDLFASGRGGATFTCIGLSGNAVYLSGETTVQYQLSSSEGSVAVKGVENALFGSQAASAALKSLITSQFAGLHEQAHARLVDRSLSANTKVTEALAGTPPTGFPVTELGNQLRMVARMLKGRTALGETRQVFFVGIGGFDNHDNLLVNHPPLLTQVADAMRAFDLALTELNLQNQVTTFTASDFGRTLTSNGDGSDHGWGSHHFVMGGAVRGRRLFGTAPILDSTGYGNDDVDQGRLLPSTSVDQLAATLATWFGVSPRDLETVLPQIGNYSTRDIGLFVA
jgi:uncharacterized protein (DUF1501 family)